MIIEQNRVGHTLTISLKGRMDATTAPLLEEVINTSLDGVDQLIFDFDQLDYMSSAGLRVLLIARKRLNENAITIINVNKVVMDILFVTGFVDIINVKAKGA